MKNKTPQKAITNIVSLMTGISVKEIFSKNRKRDIVNARRIIAVILRKELFMKYQAIGAFLKKNHAGIILYLKQHDAFLQYDQEYKKLFGIISNELKKIDYYGLNNNYREIAILKKFVDDALDKQGRLYQKVDQLIEIIKTTKSIKS
jgi:hypothetical protein